MDVAIYVLLPHTMMINHGMVQHFMDEPKLYSISVSYVVTVALSWCGQLTQYSQHVNCLWSL